MKKAQDLNPLNDLVHEAGQLRALHESTVSGNYAGVGSGENLAFMPLFKTHERAIPSANCGA